MLIWTAPLGKLRSHRRQTVDAKVNVLHRLAAVATKISSSEFAQLAKWRCPIAHPRIYGMHLALLLTLLTTAGCDKTNNQIAIPAVPPAVLANAKTEIDQVFENYAAKPEELKLTAEEVQQRLGDAQKWTDFSITQSQPDQYAGLATSPKGEELKVEIRQTANGIFTRWNNTVGDGYGYAMIKW